jgi:hypothetical protein
MIIGIGIMIIVVVMMATIIIISHHSGVSRSLFSTPARSPLLTRDDPRIKALTHTWGLLKCRGRPSASVNCVRFGRISPLRAIQRICQGRDTGPSVTNTLFPLATQRPSEAR